MGWMGWTVYLTGVVHCIFTQSHSHLCWLSLRVQGVIVGCEHQTISSCASAILLPLLDGCSLTLECFTQANLKSFHSKKSETLSCKKI